MIYLKPVLMTNVGRALLFCPLSPKEVVSVLDEALKFSSVPQGVCLASLPCFLRHLCDPDRLEPWALSWTAGARQ